MSVKEIDKRPVAYSYVRMSSKRQLKGDSLRRQMELSENYANQHGLQLDEDNTFADKGVSAWTGANVTDGDFGRFLDAVRRGQVKAGSYLLVESLDRLSRQQVRNALLPFMELINLDIVLVTLSDGQVYSKATVDANFTQLIISLTIMARAHEESETKSKRLKAVAENRRNKAAKGIGRYSVMHPGWLDVEKTGHDQYEYKLNSHAAAVRRIFELADSGIGQVIIARRLNEEEFPTPRGKGTWYQANVGRILRDEACIGTYQPTQVFEGKRVNFSLPVKGYFPAVVPDELFWRVQKNIKVPYARGRHKGNRISNLFSGLIECLHCRGPVRLRTGGKQLRYLHCENRYRHGTCDGGGLYRYDLAEQVLFEYIAELASTSEQRPTDESSRRRVEQEIARSETSLVTLERGYKNMIASVEFADDDVTRKELVANLKARRGEIEQTKALISELNQDLAMIDTKSKELASLSEQMHMERLIWTTGTEAEIFESRSRTSRMLRKFITAMALDGNNKQLKFIVAGGIAIYTFDIKGKLVEKVDFSSQAEPSAPRYWGDEIIPMPGRTDHFHFDLTDATASSELHGERAKIIKELVKEKPRMENPRLNDPDVVALKAKRKDAIKS